MRLELGIVHLDDDRAVIAFENGDAVNWRARVIIDQLLQRPDSRWRFSALTLRIFILPPLVLAMATIAVTTCRRCFSVPL